MLIIQLQTFFYLKLVTYVDEEITLCLSLTTFCSLLVLSVFDFYSGVVLH